MLHSLISCSDPSIRQSSESSISIQQDIIQNFIAEHTVVAHVKTTCTISYLPSSAQRFLGRAIVGCRTVVESFKGLWFTIDKMSAICTPLPGAAEIEAPLDRMSREDVGVHSSPKLLCQN